MPKPIQIAMAYDSSDDSIYRMALCSDGSMWTWAFEGKDWGWHRMPGIPEQSTPQTADVWR